MPGWQFGQLPGSAGWLKSPSQGPPGDHLLTDLRADFSWHTTIVQVVPGPAMPSFSVVVTLAGGLFFRAAGRRVCRLFRRGLDGLILGLCLRWPECAGGMTGPAGS